VSAWPLEGVPKERYVTAPHRARSAGSVISSSIGEFLNGRRAAIAVAVPFVVVTDQPPNPPAKRLDIADFALTISPSLS
jgi:hypothetical protein